MVNIGYLFKIIRFLTAAAFLFCNLLYKIKEKSNKQSFFPRTNSVFKTPARIFMWGLQVSQALRVCLALFFHLCCRSFVWPLPRSWPSQKYGLFRSPQSRGRGLLSKSVVWESPSFLERNPQIYYPIPDLTVKILYICCVKDLIWVSRTM